MKKRPENSKNFKLGKFQINLSNRAIYTMLAIIILVSAGVVVWAVAPNPGHTWSEIGDVPSDLADGDDVCSTSGTCSNVYATNNIELGGYITNPGGNVVIKLLETA